MARIKTKNAEVLVSISETAHHTKTFSIFYDYFWSFLQTTENTTQVLEIYCNDECACIANSEVVTSLFFVLTIERPYSIIWRLCFIVFLNHNSHSIIVEASVVLDIILISSIDKIRSKGSAIVQLTKFA